jgi:hypothetical protein
MEALHYIILHSTEETVYIYQNMQESYPLVFVNLTILTFSRLMTYIYIYISYRTANLQTLHFIYLFNKYTYWIF